MTDNPPEKSKFREAQAKLQAIEEAKHKEEETRAAKIRENQQRAKEKLKVEKAAWEEKQRNQTRNDYEYFLPLSTEETYLTAVPEGHSHESLLRIYLPQEGDYYLWQVDVARILWQNPIINPQVILEIIKLPLTLDDITVLQERFKETLHKQNTPSTNT